MNSLKEYITEKFQVSKNSIGQYTYTPKDKDELIECIVNKIKKEGYGTKDNPLDLNDIDTSKITDMNSLFDTLDGNPMLISLSTNGNFDISDWNVSNVENMDWMFYHSLFNGDISDWNVSNVTNMEYMFYGSDFTGENGDISKWDVSNVKNMDFMFCHSKFAGNIVNWNVNNVENMKYMFTKCPLQKNPPQWYHE